MFTKLIDANELHVYNFLSYCYDNNKAHYSVKELMYELNYTQSKLLSVIRHAEMFTTYYSEYTLTFFEAEKLILIEFSPLFLKSKIYATILSRSVGFKLLDSLFKEKYHSLEHLSQKYYMSLRTIQRKLGEMNKILENYHLTCSLKRMNPLDGKEYHIRYFFHLMYWQIFDEKEQESTKKVEKNQKIMGIFTEHAPYMREIDRQKFNAFLAISLQRIKKGHFLQEIPDNVEVFQHPLITKERFKKKILKPLLAVNLVSLKDMAETECDFLYFMYGVMNTYLEYDLKDLDIHKMNEGWNSEEAYFVHYLEKYFHVTLADKERIYLLVNLTMIHHSSLVFGTKNKIDAFGNAVREAELQRSFPMMYPTMKRFIYELSEDREQYLQYYEMNQRLIFQYCMLTRDVFIKYEKPLTFSLQSKYGKTQELWEKKRILNSTNRPLECVHFSEKPDLVISDYPIDLEVYGLENTPVFYWSGQPTVNDWRRLKSVMKELRGKNIQSLLEQMTLTH
ncbi:MULTISPECIES: helix-turn-helix domain-containing protein [Enterococcus]|nr:MULTISPECIES: helix-turn-helix domain-containing protein [Enterococcus]